MVNLNTMDESSGSPLDERMEVNILDYRLKVMSIKKSAISRFTHSLIGVIFLRNYQEKHRFGFVSVTETSDDYSVIAEEKALSCFDVSDCDLSIADDIWLPLVVSAGPAHTGIDASGISKIAESVIIPLADQHISVYCLSTYRTDYVLVQERDILKACAVLAHTFHITKEGLLESKEVTVDKALMDKFKPLANPIDRPLTQNYTCPLNKFYVTSMDSQSLSTYALTLIDLLFYNTKSPPSEDSDQFCCLSIIQQDISLILDSSVIERFPQNILFNTSDCWHMIKIGGMPEGLGFVRPGIVAQISAPIASAQISEYYVSSYFHGHTLVPAEHFDDVKEILEKKRNQTDLVHGNGDPVPAVEPIYAN